MPAQDAPIGIHLTDAGVTLAGKPVLTGLTLALTENRIGIVGRNGSGKTTLLRLMAGLIAPDTGNVRVAGIDPAKDRKAMLGALGILFQNPDHQIIFPTVDEELAFGLRQQGQSQADARTQVHAALAAEGRSHWANVSVQALSQGQRQYLCLMAVLLMQPAILLLDEPFSGLDMPMQLRLARRLANLRQQVIMITHDPRVLCNCDRVIWLADGRIRMDGAAADVSAAFCDEMAQLGAHDADTDIAG